MSIIIGITLWWWPTFYLRAVQSPTLPSETAKKTEPDIQEELKQEQERLQAEKIRLQEEKRQQQLEIQHQEQQKQPQHKIIQPLKKPIEPSDNLLPEEPHDQTTLEKKEEKLLTKSLEEEFAVEQPENGVKPPSEKKEESPVASCIQNLIINKVSEAKKMEDEGKLTNNSFNALAKAMESLANFEEKRFGPDYYSMSIEQIQEERKLILEANPGSPNYDPEYLTLIKEEQIQRNNLKDIVKEDKEAPSTITDDIVNECFTNALINVIKEAEERVETILGQE